MFATATRNFVEEVDNGGLLIPVSSLNDTIELLTVVVKRKRFWFWQKPKYLPTDFNLNDILTGDMPLEPVTIEIEFITFSGTYGDNIQGTLDANFVRSNVTLHGKDSSKLQSSFGSLKKEEVNVQKLLQGSKSRVLDMSHCLILQTKEKRRRVLGIVKERIVTTKPCSVIEEVLQGGECVGSLFSCGPKWSKVSLKDNGSLSKDSNVTMEIPTQTTIAYALIELEIKHGGCYELCLMSDATGGFEVDGHANKRLCGASEAVSENSRLQQDLEQLRDHFQLLSALPAITRCSLLQQLAQVMQDQAALTALQDVLDEMCQDKDSVLGDVTTTDCQKHHSSIQAILDHVEQCGEAGSAQAGQASSLLTALHLISSALDEMTNDCRTVLGMCCSLSVLNTMELLVQCASGSGELLLSSEDLTALTEEVFEKTAHLFASSKMCLKRDGDTVRTEINQESGNLPLVLCIAVRGLASLSLGV